MNYEPETPTIVPNGGTFEVKWGDAQVAAIYQGTTGDTADENPDDADGTFGVSGAKVTLHTTPSPEAAKRRAKGELEKQVREVLDAFVTGELDFNGKPATPHRVAQEVKVRHPELDKPTSGAVAAVFTRWGKIGAATFGVKPQSFVGYTLEASELGFTELYGRYKGQ